MRIEPVQVRVPMPGGKPWVTYAILGVTIFIFLLQQASDLLLGGDLPAVLGMKINSHIIQGEYWRLFSPALLHGSWVHIGFNMYAVFLFGRRLEPFYGHGRFALLYLLGAFAGNVASFWFSPNPSLGASTAVFGLAAAEGVFFFINRNLFGSLARAELQSLMLILVMNLGLGLATPNIDMWGHLGGLVGGAVYAFLSGPQYSLEGYPPDVRMVDQRTPVLAWVVAAVVGAAIALIASFKIF